MEQAVEEFTRDLSPPPPLPHQNSTPNNLTVALLGPRGSLGPYIVQHLLRDPRISKIYLLNRGQDGHSQFFSSTQTRALKINPSDPRLVFIPITLGQVNLGLSPETYTDLLNSVDAIIHNAWKIDFTLSLSDYKPEFLHSLRELLAFSIASPRHPRVIFNSSIASVMNWANIFPSSPVTEEPLSSYEVASMLGYGQSKHVAERILARASELAGVPTTVLRIGQVVGPSAAEGGPWPGNEWVPSLAGISKKLGVIPTELPEIDWVPVDVMAGAICELALRKEEEGEKGEGGLHRVYNLVNPTVTPWSVFAETLRGRIGAEARMVEAVEWVGVADEAIAAEGGRFTEAEKKAMGVMRTFFKRVGVMRKEGKRVTPRFETGKAERASEAMGVMEGVGEEGLIGIWCDQWGV